MNFLSVNNAAWAIAGVLAVSAGVASAANPVSWTTGLISVDTSTASASWTSSTAVDTGASGYQYSYLITVADIQILGSVWQNALSELGSDTSGNGSFPALPATLLSGGVNADTVGVSGNIALGVDANGFGYLNLSDFNFSGVTTGARVNATVEVTAVPEPTGIGLLAATGGLLMSRRRSRLA